MTLPIISGFQNKCHITSKGAASGGAKGILPPIVPSSGNPGKYSENIVSKLVALKEF